MDYVVSNKEIKNVLVTNEKKGSKADILIAYAKKGAKK